MKAKEQIGDKFDTSRTFDKEDMFLSCKLPDDTVATKMYPREVVEKLKH